jgi:hypothetical protein
MADFQHDFLAQTTEWAVLKKNKNTNKNKVQILFRLACKSGVRLGCRAAFARSEG